MKLVFYKFENDEIDKILINLKQTFCACFNKKIFD